MLLSYLVLRKVTDPTANFASLTRKAHAIATLIPTLYCAALYFTVKFGISVMVTCGTKSSESSAVGISRCWPILMLPFSCYFCFNLYRNSYSLVYQDVQYFLIQYTFYLFFFGLFLFYGLGLSIASIFLEFISNEEMKRTLTLLRQSYLIVKLVQLLSLIIVIVLPRKTTVTLQRAVCKCFYKKAPRVEEVIKVEHLSEQRPLMLTMSINSKADSALPKQRTASNRAAVKQETNDEMFKKAYDPVTLEKKTTLVLKTSFHLANIILMSLCSIFITDGNQYQLNQEEETAKKVKDVIAHTVNLHDFNQRHANLCIYDSGFSNSGEDMKVAEHAPRIFADIRKKYGISDDFMFKSFAPLNNIEAIRNFFPGSGKSSSFFFFSDNKAFVLKTLKDTEKALLLEKGVLEGYYEHMMSSEKTLLSKIFGVYTIRVPNMTEINCYIMENLLGNDYPFIERIYDLKGSTKGRKAKISPEDLEKPTGLRVLKDLNFIEF